MNSAYLPAPAAHPLWAPVDTATTRLAATLVWAVLALGLVLSPLGDFLSVYASNGAGGQGADTRVSLLVRGAMVAGLLIAMLWGLRVRMSHVQLTLVAALALCSTLAANAVGMLGGAETVKQLIFVIKVFSFFVYPAALAMLSDRRLAQIESIAFVSLLIYGAAIVAGASLSIEMFRSYQAETHIRSGYKGIVYAQNEAAALVVVALGFGYLSALMRGWSVRSVALVSCMLVAAMLTGTKGAMLGALGVTCVYFYSRYRAVKATGYVGIVVSALVGAAVLAYLLIPQFSQAVDLSLRYFSYQGGRIGDDKLVTLFLSGRNLKFSNVWDELQQHNFIALLTGGYPVVRYMIEIDIPDLILAFGLPIFAIYFIALAHQFLPGGRRTRVSRFGRLFFVMLMVVASTAGHVLGSAVVGPYLGLIAALIQRAARRSTIEGARA